MVWLVISPSFLCRFSGLPSAGSVVYHVLLLLTRAIPGDHVLVHCGVSTAVICLLGYLGGPVAVAIDGSLFCASDSLPVDDRGLSGD